MATKLEDSNQNGWDIDDDNDWDDWGDAEDNLDNNDTQATTTVAYVNKSATVLNNKTNNNTNIKQQEKTIEQENLSTRIVNNNFTNQTETQPTQSQLTQNKSGWGSLFGGVVSSVLSTANDLTSTVTSGLDKVIGVPDPAELARLNALEESKHRTQKQLQQQSSSNDRTEEDRSLTSTNNAAPVFGLGLVTNVTSLGSKVLNTGLDTLEGIGKKTMNILQENDPLLKNKIKKLGLEQDKPNLSEVNNNATYNCWHFL